jgi:tRNA (cmo5U34)-methyltransferase
MTTFNQTLWADSRFAQEYRENADHFIPNRDELFRILRSFYRTLVKQGATRVCDLGCGDGVISQQLLQENPSAEVILVDGSKEMLEAARARLTSYSRVRFVERSFDRWADHAEQEVPFDFIVSGFAIHHLELPEKTTLFDAIFHRLNKGGWFLNIDTVLPDNLSFTDWYYSLWQEWVDGHDRAFELQGRFSGISDKARHNPDNKLSSLTDQLDSLRRVGFEKVECYYRSGLFAIFGGHRDS